MGWFITYIITIIIAYIIARYFVISGKGCVANDDPQIVSCIVAIFWPITIFFYLLFMFGDFIDKTIKKKVNG